MTDGSVKQFFGKLREPHAHLFKRAEKGEANVESIRVVWRGTLEEELRAHPRGEFAQDVRQELLTCYGNDGYRDGLAEKLLEAVEQGNDAERRRIIEQKAGEWEARGRHNFVADELQSIGEWKRSGQAWLKASVNSFDGREYLFAAESFARGGESYKKSAARVAELVQARLASYGEKVWEHRKLFSTLGQLWEKAGEHGKALTAYKKFPGGGGNDYDRRKVEFDYWLDNGRWRKALRAHEKFLQVVPNLTEHDYLVLAELRARTRDWKGFAEALWKAREFLPAVRSAFELTGDKSYFKRAGEAYSRGKWVLTRQFYESVRRLAEQKLYESGGVAKALEIMHSAYGLPAPPEIEQQLTPQQHWQTAVELTAQFVQARKSVKGKKILELLGKGLHARALLHAEKSDRAGELLFHNELKKVFKGVPHPRLPLAGLPEEVERLAEGARSSQHYVGPDPHQMAGRAYEEGGFYKEAAAAYKKAELPDDFERVSALNKLQARKIRERTPKRQK